MTPESELWGELRSIVQAHVQRAAHVRRRALWSAIIHLDAMRGDERSAARRYLFEALGAAVCRGCGGRRRHPTTCACLGGEGVLWEDAQARDRWRGAGFHDRSARSWERSIRAQANHALMRQALQSVIVWEPEDGGRAASSAQRRPLGLHPPALPQDYLLNMRVQKSSKWLASEHMPPGAWLELALRERFFDGLLTGWVVRRAHVMTSDYMHVRMHRLGR